jgi:hypothetical protein
MFNMGGPIKQGIMTGIREPYAGGGRAALVGNPLYPRTGGREHHVAPILGIGAINAARWLATMGGRKVAQKAAQKAAQAGKAYSGTLLPAVIPKAKAAPGFWRSAWERDPMVRSAKWLKEAIMGPTAKGIGQKIVKGAVTPTGALTAAYIGSQFWPDGTKKTTEELIEDNVVRGVKDYGPHTKGPPTITQEQRDAKAKADKEKRINDLLDTMGYDKARKNAAYDALIDAGRMVSERGTLDKKNIGRELIDPIVATTSQRFDKPEQIREAVGLMQVKADIAKQMEDPQVAEQRRLNIEIAKKGLNVPFSDQKIIARKTMTGQTAFDTAASSTSDNFRGNIIPNAEWVKIKADIKEKSGTIDDITIITKWTNETIKDKDVPDGDYTVGDALVTIQEGQVVNVTR